MLDDINLAIDNFGYLTKYCDLCGCIFIPAFQN
jgi:hypothetical protein